ncbi:Uncharacterized protein SAMN05421813_10693 [Daejeonella rubra]|uniref:Photosynthesis system II assembly factor Ycf48/Hcf136-like domain-containing protein n=2 Tax=Daejeonella rubra TaxID=990371 RepID=A0A1G9QL58_9SPHI|nr:Uncharacterized protein SAMN05421813_10693 [Daejeonella rubra]
MKSIIPFFLFTILFCLKAHSQSLIPLESGKSTSLRGLSVVDDTVAWASGSKGWTARSNNGGKTWSWKQIPGYENLDFRDIEAFSANHAILLSAGTPAVILLTTDGGSVWKEVYRNESPDIFLDGMDFWDAERGLIYGDPINGKLVLLKTSDGGTSWQNISQNNTIGLIAGEASFAASGTAIRCDSKGNTWIATGGLQSRIFHSSDYGNSWKAYACPIIQGKSSTGPFSIAFYTKRRGIAVGGDYLIDSSRVNNLLLTRDGGKTWKRPSVSTFGYRSAVEYISKKVLIATGPTGTDWSVDGGRTWRKLSAEGYNTIRKAKTGSSVLLTGLNGRISRLEP